MSNGLAKLKKLKGRSAAELRVRGSQRLSALAEIWWGPKARLITDERLFHLLDPASVTPALMSAEGLLQHFRARRTPGFFTGFADPAATREELRRGFGGASVVTLRERAERIQRGRFDLLGVHDLDFGRPIDWHLDPTSGVRAPRTHWSRIDYLDPQIAGDKKFIWELNRHQHFITLGRAYWHTGNESYAITFADNVSSWMDSNPPKQGINWASNLEVSLRAISWLWALYFFKDSAALTPVLFLRLLKFLYAHARHIETYLSTYFSPNTHLTGEALGLYYLGTLLPEFKEAERWRVTGARILYDELDRHVLPDGVYFEHSTYYHRYTTDFYTHLLLLTRANGGGPAVKVLEQKLIALLDHLLYITRPDGTTPLIGDDDGGTLVPLDDNAPNDFRGTLATGASLFARADYKYVAGNAPESLLWLTGASGAREYDALSASVPSQESRAFKVAGYYVLRDGWERDANYMFLDGGPHGAGAINYGHAHADALGFDLAASGRTILIDPGTYTYTGSHSLRDHFRTSQAHNTVTIDGESSSEPAGPFRWGHVANTQTQAWHSTSRFDYFAAVHDGYRRLLSPAIHQRAVLFLKHDYWILRDRIKTVGPHRYDLSFHFAANVAPPQIEEMYEGDYVRTANPDAPGLELYAFASGATWKAEEGWVSSVYGKKDTAPVYKLFVESAGDQEFITIMMPLRVGASPIPRAARISAEGGCAFTLCSDAPLGGRRAATDLVLVKAASTEASATTVTGRLNSDFAWTWVRFGADGDDLEELILLEGQCLYLDGFELLRSARRVGWVWASLENGRWRIESDTDCDIKLSPVETRNYVRN
jgi:hypothetical protein